MKDEGQHEKEKEPTKMHIGIKKRNECRRTRTRAMRTMKWASEENGEKDVIRYTP